MSEYDIYATGISGTIGKYLDKNVKGIDIDLSSSASEFEKLKLSERSTIIHLGAIVGESLVQEDKSYASKVNVQGTRNLGEVASKSGCNKFIYVSTSHVYSVKNSPITESDLLEPKTFYAETKLDAEKAIIDTLSQSDVELTILRVFSILDWGMPPFTLGGAVERIINGEEISIANGDDERDFLTPQSIASIILKLVAIKSLPPFMNLCSSKATTVSEAAFQMFKSAQSDHSSRIVPGHSELPRIVGDNSLLKSLLPDEKCEWKLSSYQVQSRQR